MEILIDSFAKNKIRSLMSKRGIRTKKICELLKEECNIELNEKSFNNKMARKSFSATFFFQCLYVLGIKNINIDTEDIITIGVENEKN